MSTASPYNGLAPHEWAAKTRELITAYPLSTDDLVKATLGAWESIFQSSIGGFYIGKDLFPKPQIMGFLLHELIPLKLEARFPSTWRADKTADEKDLVYIPDPVFSAEIKTSSHPSQIFGNRSYAQESINGKKGKSGYYLAVNFEPFIAENIQPKIVKVRFGWLDHSDWLGQKAATGQQARLSPQVENQKLLQIYPSVSSFQASLGFSK